MDVGAAVLPVNAAVLPDVAAFPGVAVLLDRKSVV